MLDRAGERVASGAAAQWQLDGEHMSRRVHLSPLPEQLLLAPVAKPGLSAFLLAQSILLLRLLHSLAQKWRS